ncbi:hypothetical protein VB620_11585 [Nodularia harveyana UHCC-0300]|uniref:Uncharacterized protein n=1 Tax=Nodularia harveyana UHCC-0300 TaxID=2974287 RepID=A0ABU5UEM0_9CYAN|nr:hypothetical protein [Nodularia harveyana]MEA5581980.1 hypothetical protein [Nodularia harveyana UHCC-0300]
MANATLRGKRSYAVGFTTSSVQVLLVLRGRTTEAQSTQRNQGLSGH